MFDDVQYMEKEATISHCPLLVERYCYCFQALFQMPIYDYSYQGDSEVGTFSKYIATLSNIGYMSAGRLCLITFTLFTIVATLAVLAAAPHVIVK